jgi:hypothetical protein
MSDGARPTLDPRLHPYKHDIAAAHLKGEVEAEHFVEGKPHRVNEPLTDILSDQMGEARTSQALFGEAFMVYQTEGYWAWGQLMTDGYVGLVECAQPCRQRRNRSNAFGQRAAHPRHRSEHQGARQRTNAHGRAASRVQSED